MKTIRPEIAMVIIAEICMVSISVWTLTARNRTLQGMFGVSSRRKWSFMVYTGSVPDPGSDPFHISERLVRILWVKNT